MKKIITITIASFALVAVAAYSPTIGVTEISVASKTMIVPVKYTSLATTGAAVSAEALVSTYELPVGTQMYVFDDVSSCYKAWVLSSKGGAWTGVDSASTSGIIQYGTPVGGETLASGSAIWIVFPDTPDESQKIIVYGEVVASLTSTIAEGSTAAPKANLIANPTSADHAFSLGFTPQNGDTVQPIGNSFSGNYVYSDTNAKWVHVSGTTVEYVDTLPALGGYQGAWYISKGGKGTISW